MARRTIFLNGKITLETMSEAAERMLTLQMRSPDPINLVINSGGGGVYAAMHLCDIMESIMTAPVHGIALGVCGSAATFVMLHCQKRMSTPHARFMIHSGTRSEITVPINHTTSEHLEQLLQEVKATEEVMTRVYMKRLTPKGWENGRPSEDEQRAYIKELINRGDQPFNQWFSAAHAVEIGLIDEITTAKLEIFPQVK